jgi:chromate reductase
VATRVQDGQLVDKPTLDIIQAGLQELIEEIRWIAARSA